VFEKHKEKKAAEAYQAALSKWQGLRDSTVKALELAQAFNGESTDKLMLKPGEAVFATVTNAGLIEERRGKGHWQGGSTGISIPVGDIHGHAIRYHVGATRGHYVQAPPSPTAIDHGTVFVTNRRVVFQGSAQTRECLFDKLIGYEHAAGATTLSVSNRQKPTTIHYGADLEGWFGIRLELALAHYRQQVPEFVGRIQQALATVDAQKPTPPVPTR
jgi:hypothetical protein